MFNLVQTYESKNSSSDNEENAVDIEHAKTVVYDDVKMKLMKKYSDIVSKKNNFGGTQGSWYTLKFYTMKEIFLKLSKPLNNFGCSCLI